MILCFTQWHKGSLACCRASMIKKNPIQTYPYQKAICEHSDDGLVLVLNSSHTIGYNSTISQILVFHQTRSIVLTPFQFSVHTFKVKFSVNRANSIPPAETYAFWGPWYKTYQSWSKYFPNLGKSELLQVCVTHFSSFCSGHIYRTKLTRLSISITLYW